MEIPYTDTQHTDFVTPSASTSHGGAAYTSSDSALSAEYAALENPLVLAARAFECDGKVVLAVLTEPIYLSSERAELKKLLEQAASDNAGKQVAVTFDLEVYRRISRDMPDELKSLLLRKVVKPD